MNIIGNFQRKLSHDGQKGVPIRRAKSGALGLGSEARKSIRSAPRRKYATRDDSYPPRSESETSEPSKSKRVWQDNATDQTTFMDQSIYPDPIPLKLEDEGLQAKPWPTNDLIDPIHYDEIQKIHNDHRLEKEAIAAEHRLQIQELRSEINIQFSSDKERMLKEMKEMELHFSSDKERMLEEMKAMKLHFKSNKEQMLEEMKTMELHYKSDKEQMLKGMTSKHNAEMKEMELHLRSAMESLRATHETELTKLMTQDMNNKEERASKHQFERDTFEKHLRAAAEHFQEKLNSTEESHHREIERMAKEHKAAKDRMRAMHDAEKAALKIKWEQESKRLRDDVEALKAALVKRDHFKGMSDHELAHRFQDLASEVDDFARVRWDNTFEPSWPFVDKLLHNLENERRTKQYIVQNTIWVILYENIFCTPFHVLGSKGKSLELEWIDNFGQDWKPTRASTPCPRPTKESEKWRYETIKKCLELINQPQLESESKYNVKQSYELSMQEATEDIFQELGRVALISDDDKQRMGDLVRKAAKLWLDAGQRRCRVYLIMSDSGAAPPSRSGQGSLNSDGMQELVIVPELRRMGNVQGDRLEFDELVSDCKGSFSVFSAEK